MALEIVHRVLPPIEAGAWMRRASGTAQKDTVDGWPGSGIVAALHRCVALSEYERINSGSSLSSRCIDSAWHGSHSNDGTCVAGRSPHLSQMRNSANQRAFFAAQQSSHKKAKHIEYVGPRSVQSRRMLIFSSHRKQAVQPQGKSGHPRPSQVP